MSFENWLKKHKKLNNAIGDLARDFIDTNCETIEESFKKYSPSDAAYKIYVKGRRRYVSELTDNLHTELSRLYDANAYPIIESKSQIYDVLNVLADFLQFEFNL